MNTYLRSNAGQEALRNLTARVQEKTGAEPSTRLLEALNSQASEPPLRVRGKTERKMLEAFRGTSPASRRALLEMMLEMQSA